MLSVALLLQCGIRLAMALSLALHLLYLSQPLRHSYSIRHLGLVGSHDHNLSVSASGVFDILARLLLLLLSLSLLLFRAPVRIGVNLYTQYLFSFSHHVIMF